jgi:hypothetical protein
VFAENILFITARKALDPKAWIFIHANVQANMFSLFCIQLLGGLHDDIWKLFGGKTLHF